MSRNLDISIGEFYHIYSRGVDKRSIFQDLQDHQHFIDLLFVCNGEMPYVARDASIDIFSDERGTTIVDIGSYCLMPNHFHILVREKIENGTSMFMQKLLTAYAGYFNKKYKRTGALFESRFKAKHANTDEYLKYLFGYIHLNPVKLIEPLWKEKGIQNMPQAKDFLDKYQYSSYLDFVSETPRKWCKILNREAFPEYFQKTADFKDFIHDWLTFRLSDK